MNSGEREPTPRWDVIRRRTDLAGKDLRKAKLAGARLTGVNLGWAILEEANLARANLSAANLGRADLRRANLEGAILSGAKLGWANLEGANLRGANLEGTILEAVNLEGADLEGAYLGQARLVAARLRRANLAGASLELSFGLRQDQIEMAFGDRFTRLPKHIRSPTNWLKKQAFRELLEAASVPPQSPAPLEVCWDGDWLRSLRHTLEDPEEAKLDGRASNYLFLKEEINNLLERLQGNNVALNSGVYAALERYSRALGDSLAQIDIYQLGHAGISLDALVKAKIDALDDAVHGKLVGLTTSHTLFVRQEPRWREYVSRAIEDETTAEADRRAIADAEKVMQALEADEAAHFIDQDIPSSLRELRAMVSETSVDSTIKLHGYWTSFDNVLIGLFQKAVDFIRSIEATTGTANKTILILHEFSQQTLDKLMNYGSGALALLILVGLTAALTQLSDMIPVLRWVRPVIQHIKSTLSKKE